jgi:succinyl-diaminopimelate desuccinylase
MELGQRPPVSLGIMLLADEETGNHYGIDYLVKNNSTLFGKEDAFIVQDSGDGDGKTIEIAEKSVWWVKFTVNGGQAHGSRPSDGNNAFLAASKLALALHAGLYAKFDKIDNLFDPSVSTFEPTKKEANVPNVNTIPGKDIFYMDCRILPCYDVKDVEAEITRIVKNIEEETKTDIKFETEHKLSSKPTAEDAPLVKRYAEAVEKINGVKPQIIGIGGGTFAAPVRNMGLAAVVGSRIYENPHTPNEKASIKFTISDAKVIAYILASLK